MAKCPVQVTYFGVVVTEIVLIGASALCIQAMLGSSERSGFLAAAIFLILIWLCFNCIVCGKRDKVRNALKSMGTSAEFLASTKRIFILGFVFFLFN